MSKRLMKLRDRKASLLKAMNEIADKAAAETREFSESERAEYDGHEKEIGAPPGDGKPPTGLFADIDREERLANYERTLATKPDVNADTPTEVALRETGRTGIPVRLSINFGHLSTPKHFGVGPEAKERAYKCGTWYRAYVFGDQRALQQCRDWGIDTQTLAQSGATPSAGGVLVPDILLSTIIDLRETYGVFRRNVRVVPMSSDSAQMPRRTGGLTTYFVADTAATTESQKSWDSVGLTAKELACLVRYPISLAEDAIISLADDLSFEIAWGFALKEDQCGFIGDGTSTYGGITGVAVKINDGTHAASIAGAISGNVSFETLDLEDYEAALAKLPLYARPMAKWYVSNAGFATSMQRLMYAAGGNTTENIGNGVRQTFLGLPVEVVQVMNSTLGSDVSKIKVLVGDLRLAAAMGNRREISIRSDESRYFEYRQIAIQGTERFDINVHDLGDASTPGPMIAVKTAAS